MPRRLGDDPLSRKRSPSAKGNGAPSAQLGFPTQKTSHNDVFFRRNIEGPQPKPEGPPDRESSLGEATSIDEKPEISEVADIVRTAKVAESTQGADQLARPVLMGESAHAPAEEPVENTDHAPPTVSRPVASFGPPPPAAPASSQAGPQPQKSEGILKRLFGRFGK
jgi:hypothetical protein